MTFLERAQKAVCGEHLDGWLFFNFHGRDGTANRLLGLGEQTMNSRPWFCFIPAEGEPVKIVHAIEKKMLDSVPGKTLVYSDRGRLTELLEPLAGTWAAAVSQTLTVISTLDHGTALYLEGLGFKLVSSAGLIQKTAGVLDEEGFASHERAAKHLYTCVHRAWEEIVSSTTRGTVLTESTVQGWILDYFRDNGLVTSHPVLVAAGRHTADPHYEVPENGGPISPGDVIQFDIWAKEQKAGAIYADISWVGIMAGTVPPEAQNIFRIITGARDRALSFITGNLEKGTPVIGADVDRITRSFIEEAGFGPSFLHRTGHGIDTEVHGCGVNMDSTEFPDYREIIEGSCFSLEPGIYLDSFGMRTEINAYRRNGRCIVSGGPVQTRILTL